MKLKTGLKTGKPKKAEPKKAEPKRRVAGTATSPLSLRAANIVEKLADMQRLAMEIAADVSTWTGADGKVLRELSSREDSSYYWELTRKQLKDAPDGRVWVKDAVEETRAVHRQLSDFGDSFVKIVQMSADADRAEATLADQTKGVVKPAKKKGGKKKLKIKTKK